MLYGLVSYNLTNHALQDKQIYTGDADPGRSRGIASYSTAVEEALNRRSNGRVLPLRSTALPNWIALLTPSIANSFVPRKSSPNPLVIPPTSYGSPGMIDDLGLRHHYFGQASSPSTKEKEPTFRVKDDATTDTLENAMARAAIIGCR